LLMVLEVSTATRANSTSSVSATGYPVATASQLRQLIDERLVYYASDPLVGNSTTPLRLAVASSMGALAAAPCQCYGGAWIVPAAEETCPQLSIDTTVVTALTIFLIALVPSIMVVVLVFGLSTWNGALTLGSVGLQVLDVFSDAVFSYQLAREQGCQEGFLVNLAIGSIGVSILINLVISVYLLRCWRMPGMRKHVSMYWSDVFGIACMSLFGPKALDLLTSQLFKRPGMSLYSSPTEEDA